MELSARNQLRGTITSVRLGEIMAEVVLDIGGQEIVAVITRGSVERLGLAAGQPAVAIIKATEVLIAKETGE
jgi:molybdopterin-binding protein